jgi:hypothetical protein
MGMRSLKNTLIWYLGVEQGELGKRETSTADRGALGGRLQQIIAKNNVTFVLCVAMVLLLFAIQLWVALSYISQPQLVKVVGGAFGISAAGLVFQMIKLWREKVTTELLLELLPTLDASVFRTVISVLVRRLR